MSDSQVLQGTDNRAVKSDIGKRGAIKRELLSHDNRVSNKFVVKQLGPNRISQAYFES